MKSAYELAMERLNKSSPAVRLTDKQKSEIAELESRYKAREAEREIFIRDEIGKAVDKGDREAIRQLEKQLVIDRKSLRAELEEKKEKARQEPS